MDYRKRASRVCRRLAAGETLEAICTEKDMPTVETVRDWMMDSADFHGRYLRAKQVYAERLTEEVVAIADALAEGASEQETRRQRLRIEARKWVASRLAPRPFIDDGLPSLPDDPQVLVEFTIHEPPKAAKRPRRSRRKTEAAGDEAGTGTGAAPADGAGHGPAA